MFATESTRRDFLTKTAMATAILGTAGASIAAAPPKAPKTYKIITFSKPFRNLNAQDTANLVADVGWDGVELPVRSKDGQVIPEKVEEDLPKFVDALRGKGKEVSIITTGIVEVDASAEKVLRTAAKLGIKRYRLGIYRYAKDKPVPQQLAEMAPRLRDLAALNKEIGIQAGFQNHSGYGYVGAPIWDVWTMIRDLDPKHIGFCFDIGHSTLEGGETWPINFRLAEPWLTAVFVKDFYWEKTAKGWKPKWCAFGDGMVSKSFIPMLKASAYDGPISQHHEYDLGPDPVARYKQDLATLKQWLGEGKEQRAKG